LNRKLPGALRSVPSAAREGETVLADPGAHAAVHALAPPANEATSWPWFEQDHARGRVEHLLVVGRNHAGHADRMEGAQASSTLSALARSRLAVGSSARMICGRLTIARAIATRCCSPPDSSSGIAGAVEQADLVERGAGALLGLAFEAPVTSSGSMVRWPG
jgi:hypothetical protein